MNFKTLAITKFDQVTLYADAGRKRLALGDIVIVLSEPHPVDKSVMSLTRYGVGMIIVEGLQFL